MWYQKQDQRNLCYAQQSSGLMGSKGLLSTFKKIVPKNIELILIDPIALAIWYLDDGTKRNYNACRFATQSFSLEENLLLQSTLETNFKLIVKVDKWCLGPLPHQKKPKIYVWSFYSKRK